MSPSLNPGRKCDSSRATRCADGLPQESFRRERLLLIFRSSQVFLLVVVVSLFKMMFEMEESAFDRAAARPLMDEPVKKRWSWLTASTTSSSSVDETLSVEYRPYEAPPNPIETHEIVFTTVNLSTGKEEGVYDEEAAMASAFLQQQQQQAEGSCLDAALMRERHDEFVGISKSMKQLHEIQTGKNHL